MKLIIDRAKWLRGEGSSTSRLLRPSDKKMCCLGFYALSVGMTEDNIFNIATPYIIKKTKHGCSVYDAWGEGAWLFDPDEPREQSKDCGSLMHLNDDGAQPDYAREVDIIRVFAKHGVEVEFIG